MDQSNRTLLRLFCLVSFALILLSVVYRFIWLDNTPALNADEPYPIVQLMNALAGRPHLVHSPPPHSQFFNPVMMATELLTLLPGRASIFLLRLPAAITGCLTLACFAYCARRILPTRNQIFFATLLLAAMPMSIAFSRIQWDTSYLPLFECFVLFPMLEFAAGKFSRRSLAVIVGVSILGLWTHAIFLLLMVCLGPAVLFVRRREIVAAVGTRLNIKPGAILAIAVALAPIVAAIALFLALTLATDHDPRQIADDAFRSARELLSTPGPLFNYISRIGDTIAGITTYQDIAGLPITPDLHAFSRVILALLALAAIVLMFSPNPADRALAGFWIIVPLVLIATARMLTLDKIGFERYAIWLLPPAAVTLARFGARLLESRRRADLSCAMLILPLSAIMLFTFVPDYFDPIRQLSYRQNTYPAYWSAPVDPKFAAADWIRQNAPPHTTIYAENWWIDYPLQYDLGLDWKITEDALPSSLPRGAIIIVCFCNSTPYADIDPKYFDDKQKLLAKAGRKPSVQYFYAADGKRPLVAVVIAKPQ